MPTPHISASAAPSAPRDILRSVMPYIESNIVAIASHYGFHISTAQTLALAAVLGLVLSALLRALESRWRWVGALLGFIGVPAFPATAKAQSQAYTVSLEARIAELEAAAQESKSPSAPSTSTPTEPVVVATPEPAATPVVPA